MSSKLSEICKSSGTFIILCITFLFTSITFANELSLQQASQKLVMQHPQLQQFAWRFKALEADSELAQQRPATRLSIESAELAGSGEYSGVKSAETTVALSSVFELGGKRQARLQASEARMKLAQAEQEAQVFTLLSALTQQFVQTLALQEQCSLKQEGAALALRTEQIVQERVNKAAAPEAELLRAKVSLIQAKLEQSNCQVELAASKQALAVGMGQKNVDFERLQGDLFQQQSLEPVAVLEKELSTSPLLQVYSQQLAAQNSEIAQAQSDSKLDIQWTFGVTHFAATDDAALGLGLEVPLFTGQRNRPRMAQLQAQSNELVAQQQLAEQMLFNTLYNSAMQHTQNSLTLQSLRYEAVPLLERAYKQAQSAYQQGRYSYTEWTNSGQELLATKAAAIVAAENVLLNQAIIEGLLGGAK